MQIESSIITGSFTLLGVAITLFFTRKREKSRFLQDLKVQNFARMEAFYVDLVSTIDLSIKCIKNESNNEKFHKEQSEVSAKANLIAPLPINHKLSMVSNVLYEWSSLHRQSLPHKLGDTGLGVVSNESFELKEKAEIEFIKLQQEMSELIQIIRKELETQRKCLMN